MLDIRQHPDDYDLLISAIYQGPLDDTPWQGFLALLSSQLNAFAVSLVLRPPSSSDSGLILNFQRPDAGDVSDAHLADPEDWQASAYRKQFFALDPFVNLAIGEVVTLAELLPAADMAKSEYFTQYLKPAGVFQIIGADTREPDGLVACLRACRGEQDPEFNQQDKGLIATIMSHLKRAVQLHARINHIESERNLYAHAVGRMAVGSIILDENCKVLSTNAVATQLLAEKDGLRLVQQSLQIHHQEQAREFQQLFANVLNQDSNTAAMAEALRVTRPSGRADLGLVIRPVPTSQWFEGQSGPSVAVFISDPEQQHQTSQQIITRLFGFTPAEAALSMLLAKGLSLAHASEKQAVSQHTARAQLKSIFAKTGVSRQAELVRLIVKSVANLG